MVGRLVNELKMSAPFASVEEEAGLNILRMADLLRRDIAVVLKPFGISHTQYNVLRILRGALKEKESRQQAKTCGEIAERLITFEPDVTRVLDKLEKQEFITRERSHSDRRVVRSRITEAGLSVLSQLQPKLKETLHKRLGRLNRTALSDLITHLEALRD